MGMQRRDVLRGGAAGLLLALGRPARAQPPQPAGAPIELTFLHVNDIYEHAPVDGRGGLAELATLIERERAAAQGPVIFTFGGDLISPSLASGETKGRHMITLFNALGLDVAVLGNHEFDFGPEIASERMAESRFPWLGANVTGADGRLLPGVRASVLHDAGAGLTIGFAGILTAKTAELAPSDAVAFGPELPALEDAFADLRRQGAGLLVALTHQDLEEDRVLARTLSGVTLVLGGHDHDPASILEQGTLVLRSGSDAHWLGRVRLLVRPPARPGDLAEVQSMGWAFIPNVGIPPSPRIAPLVAAVEAQLARSMDEPLAILDTPLDSRTAVVRRQEAALGNLVADALRAHFQADIGLMNGGGLRGDREYPAGTVLTRRDLAREMPFGNAVMLLELSDTELREALENGLSEVERGSGRFPQIAGMTLVYDPVAPAGDRLKALTVGGRPADPARRYTLATTNYLAAGGDGYDTLKGAVVTVDASGGPLLVNVVAAALQRAGRVAPVVEGRIRAR